MNAVDVLVVGGGPAGLCAAIAAAEGGASATLVDEWPKLGGRLRYRRADIEVDGRSVSPVQLIESLVARAQAAGVDLRADAVAWSAFSGARGLEVGVRGPGWSEVLSPGRLVLATGTTDRSAIVPGATLPGVLTARALQILLNVHGVRPGQRFAILGDDRVDELTADIDAAGGTVARVVASAEMASVVIDGQGGVRGIVVEGESTVVDVVVVALGALPDTQLARMAGAASARTVSLCGTAASATTIEAAMADGERVGR